MKCPEIIKEAWITKQSDAMGRAVRKGILSISNAAKATKKLKLKPRLLKTLGTGMEGTANLMTHPVHGTAVNKIFNPKSQLFNKGLIHDKAKILKKMKGKGYPLYYGKGSGKNSITMEYIQRGSGDILDDIMDFTPQRIRAALKIKAKTFMRTGKLTSDYIRNPLNMIKTPSGKYKVIDFLPITKNLRQTPMFIKQKQDAKYLRKQVKKIIMNKQIPLMSKVLHPGKYFSNVKKNLASLLMG